ncbi:hypothetical protein NLG97_g9155 [Lecanicillium saksenae]|uniref:Uncharacterized protein n=1 Tax=Lecanicillium saksenae TaxID=468837 RepID=A0ACC1QIT5_9HYPO|nr:hypothetical protein NLG97_g9155 [Lecanicillium saksenae]
MLCQCCPHNHLTFFAVCAAITTTPPTHTFDTPRNKIPSPIKNPFNFISMLPNLNNSFSVDPLLGMLASTPTPVSRTTPAQSSTYAKSNQLTPNSQSPRKNPFQPSISNVPAVQQQQQRQQIPPRDMVTFSRQCPVTSEQHSFTLTREDLLSAKTLEGICYSIRWSKGFGSEGICAARSRALMELIYEVIEWEKGLRDTHPLLLDVGSLMPNKKPRQE